MSEFFKTLSDTLIEAMEDFGLPSRLNPEVRLAAAVVLVDIASVDNDFDDEEYKSISRFLRKAFSLESLDIRALITKAQAECQKSQAEINTYIDYINDHLDQGERAKLLSQIRRIILADNVEHPFEKALMERYEKLLA